MFENIFVLLISDLVEIVHVQLANKGRKIAVSKVNGEDFLLKFLNIDDNEVGSFLIPCDNVLVLIVLRKNKRYL